MSFLCSNKTGAILSLPVRAQRQDTLAQGDFGKWIVNHIDLWLAFTRSLGLGITRMEDIVFVTGCHLATSWANIAFSEGCGEEQVSFGVRVSTDRDSGSNVVEWRFPPEEIQGVASNLGPSGWVGFCAFLCSHRYQDDNSWTDVIESEFTRGSVHIYQRISCYQAFWTNPPTSRSGRGRRANSQSR